MDSLQLKKFSHLREMIKMKSKTNILDWLCSDNCRVYSVEVARKIGSINAAIYLSELVQRFEYHSIRNELIDDERHGKGWFCYTAEKCLDRTSMSIKEQKTALCYLIRLGLIEQKNFGVPCKRHFRINKKALELY